MAHLQFTNVQAHPTEFLDITSLTRDEFQQLVPPFEAAFQAHMAAWRLDGKPRTARQFAVYKNCPLPTPEDRLFFILAYEAVEEFEGPHWSSFEEIGGARSTNLRHHSDSHRNCFLIETRNRYEPIRSITVP
jgi:hypothetical protein